MTAHHRAPETPAGPRGAATNGSRRRFLAAGAAVSGGVATSSLWPSAQAQAARPPAVKQKATLYTPAKVAAARANVARFGWAAEALETARARAADLVAQSDDWIWSAVTSQKLARSALVNKAYGSPVTGQEILKFGTYAYTLDVYRAQWKITDPSCDMQFPTNDFAAFYASALNDHGEFDPDLGDRSLLVNELYPERGPTWGVDDGRGWIDDEGRRFTFIAYYNHWGTWGYSPGKLIGGWSLVSVALVACRDAFLYTGEMKYAHAGLILLDRIADVYGSLDTGAFRLADGFLNSDGGTGRGKETGSIWATFVAKTLASSYDAFFPAIATDDGAGIVDFLRDKAIQHGLPAKDTIADVRSNIEHGILRLITPEVRVARIRGNFGMHQSAAAMAAVVLDHAPESIEWLDFVFSNGALIHDDQGWRITGGGVNKSIIDDVDRDGWAYESPQYSRLWTSQLAELADILDGFELYPAADLYQHPKYRAMVLARPSLTLSGTFTPCIGDTLAVGRPGVFGSPEEYTDGFARYGDPVQAQMAYLQNENSVDGLHTKVFDAEPEQAQQAIREVINSYGTLDLATDNLTGLGAGVFRDVNGGPQALLYSGPTKSHGQRNSLYIDLWGYGVNLAGSLGYPEYTGSGALRVEWHANTIGANTVVVDAGPQQQAQHNEGQPQGWLESPEVTMTDVAAPTVYPGTERYRRSLVKIKINDTEAYYLDLFRVDGGNEHVYSFHAVASEAMVAGVELTRQPTGSYAGADVEPPADNVPGDWTKSGYDWLSNVSRGQPSGKFTVDWAVRDPYEQGDPDQPVRLRLTMLNEVADIALADGRAARNAPVDLTPLRYLLARRSGTDLSSRFVSILEPYRGAPIIRAASQVEVAALDGTLAPGDVTAVKVELVDGRVDYIISSLRPEVQVKVDDAVIFRGSFGMVRLRDGASLMAVTADAVQLLPLRTSAKGLVRKLSSDHGSIEGAVTDFTRELSDTNMITLRLTTPTPDPASVIGRYLFVESDGIRNATYRIDDASASGSTLTLRVRGTTVRSFVDADDESKGYVHDVAVGRAARIPIVRRWAAS